MNLSYKYNKNHNLTKIIKLILKENNIEGIKEFINKLNCNKKKINSKLYNVILILNNYGIKRIYNLKKYDSYKLFKLSLDLIKRFKCKNKEKLKIIIKINIGIYYRSIFELKKSLKIFKNLYYNVIWSKNNKILSLVYNNLSVIYFDLKKYKIGYDYIKISSNLISKLISKINLNSLKFYDDFKYQLESYLFSLHNRCIFENLLNLKKEFDITYLKLKDLTKIYKIDNELKNKLLFIHNGLISNLNEKFTKKLNKMKRNISIDKAIYKNKRIRIKSTSIFKLYSNDQNIKINNKSNCNWIKNKFNKKNEINKNLLDISFKYINKINNNNMKSLNFIKNLRWINNKIIINNSNTILFNKNKIIYNQRNFKKIIIFIQSKIKKYLLKENFKILNRSLYNFKFKFKKYFNINKNKKWIFNVLIQINYKYIEITLFNKEIKKIFRIFKLKEILNDEYIKLYFNKKSILNFKYINNIISKKIFKMIIIKYASYQYKIILKDNLFLNIKKLKNNTKKDICNFENDIILDNLIESLKIKFNLDDKFLKIYLIKIQKLIKNYIFKKYLKFIINKNIIILERNKIIFNEIYFYFIWKRKYKNYYLFTLIKKNLNYKITYSLIINKNYDLNILLTNLFIININKYYINNFLLKNNDNRININKEEKVFLLLS